jgi:4-amino-4-deoxy-L-arabinose transferase-like glycosyltransferase
MRKKTIVLLVLIIAKFILQYALINPVYDLHRDEYLHLDQGRHLAWGYVSVPPVTSWISYLIGLLGNSVFWVKFFPALFGALTIVVVWKTIETLKGGWFALVLGALSVLFSVLMRINILYQPNSLDILLWTLLYFTLTRYIDTGHRKWLWIAGISFGLGFLNKYNIAFLAVGLLPALLLTPQRRLLGQRDFYIALGIAALIMLPNLLWQYNNGFPVFHHLDELARTQLVNVSRAGFLKEQLLFFIGSIFVLLAALLSFFTYPPFKKYRVILYAFVFTLSIFVYFKAKGYYAIGLYPILLAFGAVYMERLLSGGWKRYLRPLVLALPVLLFLPLIKVVFPVDGPAAIQRNAKRFAALGLLRWEDGKEHLLPQDFADMLGWKETAAKVDRAAAALAGSGYTLVLCDNYGQAGAINYYSAHKNSGAVSMNADYINWIPLDQKIENVILVKDQPDEDSTREKEKRLFETVTLFDQVNNPYAREYGTRIFVLKNARADINGLLRKEIEERKRRKE